ncbi:RHS repeat-associated core domain-containing protein [Lentisphaerota bacterium WC36G]
MALEKDGVVFNYIADGNKNITQLIDMSSGSVANLYDYSPFGQLSLDNETVANPFRFSSEYAEKETGLIYYNYRYYNPTVGKWTKRDPIQEKGGQNLYGFVNNRPIIYYDNLGAWASNGGFENGTEEMAFCEQNFLGEVSDQTEEMLRDQGRGEIPYSDANEISEVAYGAAVIYLFTAFEYFVKDNGCEYFCLSWTPMPFGIEGSITANHRNSTPSPCSIGIGAMGVGQSISGRGSVTTTIGLSENTISPLSISIRLSCSNLNDKDKSGCPCEKGNKFKDTIEGAS